MAAPLSMPASIPAEPSLAHTAAVVSIEKPVPVFGTQSCRMSPLHRLHPPQQLPAAMPLRLPVLLPDHHCHGTAEWSALSDENKIQKPRNAAE